MNVSNERKSQILELSGDLDSLPAMPKIARQIMTLDTNDYRGENKLVELVQTDAGISARIISLANRPSNHGRPISSIKDAITLIGLTQVKYVALSCAIMSLSGKPSKHFNPSRLFEHGMEVAMSLSSLTRDMPSEVRPTEDLISLVGILHNIGFIVLHHLDPELSDDLHATILSEPNALPFDIELRELGFTHCDLGANLAVHWGLPDEIVSTIKCHHTFVDENKVDALSRLTGLVECLLPDIYGRNPISNLDDIDAIIQQISQDAMCETKRHA